MGIVVTLSLVNKNTEIHFGTDSAAAISAIVDYTSKSIYRRVTQYKCELILEMIKEMLGKKNISLFLYKIKAHSQHWWNDQADKLVRIGTGQTGVFELNISKITQLSYYYK